MPVPSCAKASAPLCPTFPPALRGGQAFPPSLPPSFFILVILKGPLWGLMYHLWGCQRHLGMGWGSLMFPCRETPNNKGNGPTFDSGVCFCLNLPPRRAQQALSCRDSAQGLTPAPALPSIPFPIALEARTSAGVLGIWEGRMGYPLQGQGHTAEVPHGPAGPTCPAPLSPDPFFPHTLCPCSSGSNPNPYLAQT